MELVRAAFLAVFLLSRTNGCSENAVRLAGIGSERVGRIQVCQDGEWKEVCVREKNSDNGIRGGWRASNAVVACRQLGYSHGFILTTADRFALGNITGDDKESHMTNHVTCSGLESSLDECPTIKGAEKECRGTAPVVMCTDNPGIGSVRLVHVESQRENEGVVEVYSGSEWVGVCSDQWSVEDSGVVCRQLGYKTGTPTLTKPHSTVIRKLLEKRINYFLCSGDEGSLIECNHTVYSSRCHSATYASVNCTADLPITTDQDATDAPSTSVSLDIIMSFAAVQLVVVILSVILHVIILVTWTKWRKSKVMPSSGVNSAHPHNMQFPPPPPSYTDSTSTTVPLDSASGSPSPPHTNADS